MKKKGINKGRIDNKTYYKTVSFSKAVLWKDRTLSLPPEVIQAIVREDVQNLVFTDPIKLEKWIFNTDKVLKSMQLQRIGQEEQYYFPIDLAKRISIEEEKEITEPAQEVQLPLL